MSPPAAGDHPWPSWFQDTVQHAQLLTNRSLRSYLLAHSAERWPEVVKASLLYGVLCLKRDFPGQPTLDLPQLLEASRRLHSEAAINSALPHIRSQFKSLEADVGGFMAELSPGSCSNDKGGQVIVTKGEATAGSSGHLHGSSTRMAGRRGPQPSEKPPPQTRNDTMAASAPAATATVRKPKNRAVYPDWWPKESVAAAAAARRAVSEAKARPQPRLAYSRPRAERPSVTRDDLSTAAFLLVPPRVNNRSGVGRAVNQARVQAQSKVKLQHAQRLELQEHENERPSGGASATNALPLPSVPADAAAAGNVPYGYHSAMEAKWRQHFGL